MADQVKIIPTQPGKDILAEIGSIVAVATGAAQGCLNCTLHDASKARHEPIPGRLIAAGQFALLKAVGHAGIPYRWLTIPIRRFGRKYPQRAQPFDWLYLVTLLGCAPFSGGGKSLGGRSWKIRLRVGITAIFLGTMVPLIAGLVGYIFVRNTELALRVADEAMDRTAQEVIGEIQRILAQNQAVAEVAAAAGALAPDRFGTDAVLPMFGEVLEANPLLYSVYAGFEQDGIFNQTIRLPHGSTAPFGLFRRPPPPETERVYRAIRLEQGERIDQFRYRALNGRELHTEEGPASYDPRQRPWYQAAQQSREAIISPAYVFASSGEPGFTLSRRFLHRDGTLNGVVGVDITLRALSNFLAQRRLPDGGTVFVVDQNDTLVGYPSLGAMLGGQDGKVVLYKVDQFAAAPQVSAAFREWRLTNRRSFTFHDPATATDYLATFVPVATTTDVPWVTAVVVPLDAFVGRIRDVTLSLAIASLLVIALAVMAVIHISRLLTRPIHDVVQETERIRRFDLSGEFRTDSNIVEIRTLARSVQAMKNALHSFSLFVPKDIVRDLIVRGDTANLGGQRRQVTILFSDIENFTGISEHLPPEAVMQYLSDYFEALNRPIHDHDGVVDKFIGDAIMAIWNAPREDDDHIAHACLAALACRAVSEQRRHRAIAAAQPAFRTRFGLHVGEAVVGTVGSLDRMQFTVLGANVNLASRVEALNKHYGTDILVTAPVELAVRERFILVPIDIVQPVGVAQPVELFALLGPADDRESGELAMWRQIIGLFRAGDWVRCLALLERFSADQLPSEVVALYHQRCISLIASPPVNWTPVIIFTAK